MRDDLDDALEALIPGVGHQAGVLLDDPPFPIGLALEPRGVVGRGGASVVYEAFDPVLERALAIKIARPGAGADGRRAVLEELRRMVRVGHPAVPTVLGLRVVDGLMCGVLPMLDGRTLARAWDERGVDLAADLSALGTIAGALAAAHAVGVVHGDVHPGNVMIGERGSVWLLDWAPPDTRTDAVTGHLRYLAPEVLFGAGPSPAADAWSLGALLFEAVLGRPVRAPDLDGNAAEATRRWRDAGDPAPLDEVREFPALSQLIDDLLRSDPSRRPDLATAQRRLAQLVTGRSERARRARRASVLHAHAFECIERIEALIDRLSREREALAIQRSKVPGHAPIVDKRAIWETEDRISAMRADRHEAWWQAIEASAEAYFLAPEPDAARATLAGLWWRALKQAEGEPDPALISVARRRVIALDGGALRGLLDAPGHVSLEADIPGATVEIARFVERGRRLVPEVVGVAPLPLRKHALARGSWLLTVRAPGRVDAPVPIAVRRLEHHRARVALFRPEQVGDGYLPMPEGPYQAGGDKRARQPLPRCEPFIGARFVRRTLVTTAEWKAFLDALPADEAARHVPGEAGLFGGFRPAWGLDADGWQPPPGWALDWPIFAVNHHDASAFAAWRSAVEGRTVRLPTEEEWEKAARGVDGRAYPWGDGFDPTWCRMRQSAPGAPLPGAVGSYPVDASVYGCLDMAGLLRELTSTPFDDGQLVLRGGTWGDDADDCRVASRSGIQPMFRSSFVGFRLIADDVIGSR
jgi:eukaryotic-like serine/threonine-protein kinase